MLEYIWPIFLIVGSNVIYHLISKSTPQSVNPFASLLITYLVGAAVSFVMYVVTSGGRELAAGFKSINWTSYALGLAIIGLEAGYIFLYRAGWSLSTASLTANISLAVILLIIGVMLFKDAFGYKQLLGALLCFSGLILINMK